MEVTTTAYQGPLPLPAHLEHYERIVPGAGERTLRMAETQAANRQGLERWTVRTNAITSIMGSIFGLIIALSSIKFASELLANQHPIAGVTTLLGTIAAFSGVFVYGKQSTRKERAARADSSRPTS